MRNDLINNNLVTKEQSVLVRIILSPKKEKRRATRNSAQRASCFRNTLQISAGILLHKHVYSQHGSHSTAAMGSCRITFTENAREFES